MAASLIWFLQIFLTLRFKQGKQWYGHILTSHNKAIYLSKRAIKQ